FYLYLEQKTKSCVYETSSIIHKNSCRMAEKMPKLNLQQDAPKLTQAQLDYMKIVEKQNAERVRKLLVLKKKNIATGIAIGCVAVGIYGYTMYAMKQESFLDELE
ncbi:Cytochrome c oxidase assembly factor 3, mitochondrial, partial [Halocaridina rubra]